VLDHLETYHFSTICDSSTATVQIFSLTVFINIIPAPHCNIPDEHRWFWILISFKLTVAEIPMFQSSESEIFVLIYCSAYYPPWLLKKQDATPVNNFKLKLMNIDWKFFALELKITKKYEIKLLLLTNIFPFFSSNGLEFFAWECKVIREPS
jgi:hypothetical protein